MTTEDDDETAIADLRSVPMEDLAAVDSPALEATLRRLRKEAEGPADGAVSGFSSAI